MFRLAVQGRGLVDVGVQARAIRLDPAAPQRRESLLLLRTLRPDRRTPNTPTPAPKPDPSPPPTEPPVTGDAIASAEQGSTKQGGMPDMPEMPVAGTGKEKTGGAGELTEVKPPETSDAGTQPSTAGTARPPGSRAEARPESSVIRTADQLRNALSDPAARGGTLRIAADADLEIPSIPVRVAGSWRIQAESGATRPRLRFLPSGSTSANAVAAWTAMLDLRVGSLQLEGIDVVLPKNNAPAKGGWAAFLVRAATDLSLTGCTVTVEGEQPTSAVVAVSAAGNNDEGLNGEVGNASPATVRLSDSLLRGGGDCVDVSGGQRLTVEFNNTVVSAGGSLLRAHGIARGQEAESIGLTLRQVTARAAEGLVRIESAATEPELPIVDVNARDSILLTTPDPSGAPLLRVDGQAVTSSMRDRIVWEGHGVVYHQIRTYRRDQSGQIGAVPTLYDRGDWTVAVGSRETSAVHGDAKFLHPFDAERPAWRLRAEDVRLAPDSPAASAGPDLERIPSVSSD